MKTYRFEIGSTVYGHEYKRLHSSEIVASSVKEASEIAELAAMASNIRSANLAILLNERCEVVWSTTLPTG